MPSTANIFGAGHDEPPAPAGGGAGVLPPMWLVPQGASIMIVTDAAGVVTPISDMRPPNEAGGDMIGPTYITSFGGISGIEHRENGMFLVGVFLTDEPPEADAPAGLDFSANEDVAELAPAIAQTFFIGDGLGRRFIVPSGATRLFLGFADGYFYQGQPGWYGNNAGQLAVTVEFASE